MSCLGEPDWLDLVSDDPLNDGLVSLYLAGEHTWGNPRWFDAVHPRNGAGGNHGVLTNGPTWQGAMGRQGGFGSLLFDGTDDYVAVLGSLTLIEATFCCWLKLDAPDAYAGVIFSRGTNVTGLQTSNDGTKLAYNWNDASSAYNWSGGPALSTGEWLWCAVSVNSAAATAYVGTAGGSLVSATNTLAHSSTVMDSIRIGGDSYEQASRSIQGRIDAAKIFNVAKSDSQMVALYKDDLAGNPLTLNRVRPYTVSDVGGGAPPGGSILSQMLNNGLFVGSAA